MATETATGTAAPTPRRGWPVIWRWLLAILIALNIGAAGWVVHEYHERVLPPLADPGIPLLELLSTPGQATAPAPATSSGTPERHGQNASRK